jgi:hypothetical protein
MRRLRMTTALALVLSLSAVAAVASTQLTVDVIEAEPGPDGTLTVHRLDVTDGDGTAWQLDGEAILAPVPVTPGPDTTLYDRVLTDGDSFPDGFTVPADQVWGFDPDETVTVEAGGNVIVQGELVAHPASVDVVHTLRFVGIDESKIVGGHSEEPLATDVGLWVTSGRLDFAGTPRTGWNRTGQDPTWQPDDELIVAPQKPGEFQMFAPFTAGDPIPTVEYDGISYPTEVANLTRNVVIESDAPHSADMLTRNGRAHVILLNCQQPSSIKWAAFRNLGPRRPSGSFTTNVDGRNPLHLHKCGDGSRGTEIEGVVVTESGSGGISPHDSHGITIRDTVVYDTYDWGVSWPSKDATDDLTIDRAAVMKVRAWPWFRGYGNVGFDLLQGNRTRITDSVATGVAGSSVNAGGFRWRNPQTGPGWDFGSGNVAHNNSTPGLGVWDNSQSRGHVIDNFVAYNNPVNVSHGAYVTAFTYRHAVTFGGVWDQHALSTVPDEPHTVEDVVIGGNLVLKPHTVGASTPTFYRDVRVDGKVVVHECGGHPGVIEFHSSSPEFDLDQGDFEVKCQLSTITVFNSDGSEWTLTSS